MAIKIGLLGLSHWYFSLGTAYQIWLHPDAELIAVADPNINLLAQVTKTYRIQRSYSNYEELLSDPDVEAIVFGTTTRLQPQLAKEAIRSGKHVLLCKPISRTLAEADSLLEYVHNTSVVLAVAGACPSVDDPIKRAIKKGIIGSPYAVHQSIHAIEPYSEPGNKNPGWFVDPIEAAGGAFIDHAIYDIATARWYLEDEVTSIRAYMRQISHPSWIVEDYGFAQLEFSKGGIGTIESTFTGHYKTRYQKTILGTLGRIEMIDDQMYIFVDKSIEKVHKTVHFLEEPNPVLNANFLDPGIPEPPFASGCASLLSEFIECIKTGKHPIASGEHARRNLEVGLAAYLSSAVGGDIHLPLVDCPDVNELLNNITYFKV